MRILLLAFIISACSSISPEAKKVRVLRKGDAPISCKELEKVHAPGLTHFSDEARENTLKQKTHDLGGNIVTIDRVDANNTYFGTAYKCQ